MKNSFGILVSIVLFGTLMTSCDPKQPEPTPEASNGKIHLKIKTLWYDEAYDNMTIVQDAYGNRLRIENFVSYISSLALKKPDGTKLLLKDYYLANFSNEIDFDFTVPKGDYTGIDFLLGVPADVNTDTDPAQYPNTHPLSVPGSQGMFWSWMTGYIFTKLEGRADTTGTEDEPVLYPFSYHTGDDEYSRNAVLDEFNFTLGAGETKNITLTLHANKIFSPDEHAGINIEEENSTHSPGTLALKFVRNFSEAFSIE